MKRKVITRSVALAAACAMVLSGCGSKPANNTGSSTPSTSEAKTESSASSESKPASDEPIVTGKGAGYDYIANLPKLSEEKVSYKVAVSQEVSQKNWNDMEFFKALEEATNVHIEFECTPQANYKDQKNLMLASGEYPDAFLGYATLNMTDLNQYGPMGVFVPVEDLIEEYGTNYKKVLADRPVLDGLSTAFDGHKYSWGTVNEHPNRDFPDNLYINKQWLDNLGLAVPTTIDEYYEVLKAFKEQDANGNGDKNDEIPYTFLPFHHIQGYGSFFGAWGRAESFNGAKDGKVEDHFVVENDKVVYAPVTEEYKTAIIELSKFFKDGLFDKEGFVQDNEQMNAKVTSTTPIVGSMYNWDVLSMPEENQKQYIAIKPLKASADSPDAAVHKRQNHISIQATGLSITNKCKNPEILAQWIDLFYTEAMTVLSYYGPERVLEINADGKFTFDEAPSADGAGFSEVVKQNAPFDGTPKFLTYDIIKDKIALKSDTGMKVETINEFYLNAPASLTLPTMNYKTEENDFLTSYGLSVQSYVMEMQCKWLMGQSDIEKDWDGYLKQLETLKVAEFVDMMQSIYDRTIGK